VSVEAVSDESRVKRRESDLSCPDDDGQQGQCRDAQSTVDKASARHDS